MLKRSVLALTLVLVLVSVGLAQSDQQAAQRDALQKLLLTQDEVNQVLPVTQGQPGWILQATGKLAEEPSGAITAAMVYRKPGEQRGQVFQFTDALLEFVDGKTASSFFTIGLFKDLFTSPILPLSGDPKLAKIKQGLDVGGTDNKGADDAIYATLQETNESLIAFVKDQHICFVRGNLNLIEELLPLAKKQLDILVNGRPQQ
jgi:hypothetical protein